jgi:inner membrane protein
LPTVFTHSLVGICSGISTSKKLRPKRFWFLSIGCAIIPDADVLAFKFSIPYSHMFGHRGFFHSIFFAFIFGFFISLIFFKRNHRILSKEFLFYWMVFFFITASHGFLDALTNGGLGIALLSPFSNQRIFFSSTPIIVSPIGLCAFLTKRSLLVLKSEIVYVWLPCITVTALIWFFRKVILRMMMR